MKEWIHRVAHEIWMELANEAYKFVKAGKPETYALLRFNGLQSQQEIALFSFGVRRKKLSHFVVEKG